MPDTQRPTAADRRAIVDGLRRYAYGIDDRDFEAVRDVFAPDATLDYTASGGPRGPRDEVVAWIQEGLGMVGPSQHLLSNELVEVAGDEASSRCYLFNPLLASAPPSEHVLLLGGEYRDRWHRRDGTWRIVERTHVVTWTRTLT